MATPYARCVSRTQDYLTPIPTSRIFTGSIKPTSRYWRCVYVAHEQNRYRIESGDYSYCNTNAAGLLPEASVEPDKHVSMHPALLTVFYLGWLAQYA